MVKEVSAWGGIGVCVLFVKLAVYGLRNYFTRTNVISPDTFTSLRPTAFRTAFPPMAWYV